MDKVAIGNGRVVRVAKYHSQKLARAAAIGANGTRKDSAFGHGGAQRVVLGDIDDPRGCFWVAACNRDAAELVAAGYEYEANV